jgi:hypothetical protein
MPYFVTKCREYLDNLALFRSCGEKLLDAASVLLREIQVLYETGYPVLLLILKRIDYTRSLHQRNTFTTLEV